VLRARMIDTIGHLSLAGAPLIGHMRGYRSSPALHHALLRALLLRRAAARISVDAYRRSPMARRAEEEASLLATSGPTGYFH
jgi:UDP-3-O-acyl-N-acetylglucosamine deacetylase